MSYSVLRTVLGCRLPSTSHCRQERFYRLKNPVSILSWNQGDHNMGHSRIQTDHNLDHKFPDYGQPANVNMYDQTMVSLESCFMYYDRE